MTVAAVGPLTNIALLLRVFPDGGRADRPAGGHGRLGRPRRQRDRGRGVQRVGRRRGGAGGARPRRCRRCWSGWTSRCPTVLDEDGHRPVRRGRPDRRARPRRSCSSTWTTRGPPTARPASSCTTPWPSPRRSAGHPRHRAARRRRRHRAGLRPRADPGRPADVSAAPTAVDVAERVDSAAAVEFLVSPAGVASTARADRLARSARCGRLDDAERRCRGACGCSAGRRRAGSRRPARRRRAAGPSARPWPAR